MAVCLSFGPLASAYFGHKSFWHATLWLPLPPRAAHPLYPLSCLNI